MVPQNLQHAARNNLVSYSVPSIEEKMADGDGLEDEGRLASRTCVPTLEFVYYIARNDRPWII